MRLIYAKLKHHLLQIGRRRENLATQVVFEGYPDEGYSVQVFVKRNGDAVAYPASNVVIDSTDRVIRWNVTATDTDKQGTGEVQLRYSDASGVVVKTEIYSFNVTAAIDTDAGPAPDPYETWLDSLTDLAGTTQVNARAAEASATSAQASAESAEQSATAAEGSAASASASEQSASQSASSAHTDAQTATTKASEAQASASSASQSASIATTKASEATVAATTATTKANEASASAEAAAQSAAVSGYMWFWVGEDGHLYMDRTSNVEVDFVLSETDGHLYATA